MKTDIYYFSGTGNCLFFAQKICDKIENSQIISIPQAVVKKTGIKGDIIGIVCPIYMYRMPLLVAEFIRKIESAEYIFLVFAGAGNLGVGIKDTMKIFEATKHQLSSLFNVPLPSNYAPFGATPKDKQKKLFANSDNRVEEIIKIVKNRGSYFDSSNTSFIHSYIHPGLLYQLGYNRINIMDKSFTTDEKCNGCSICMKVCPVNNITMKDNRPVWNNKCQQCYACLQWCPTVSVQAGKRTVGVERYHHPDIAVKDIIRSSPEELK